MPHSLVFLYENVQQEKGYSGRSRSTLKLLSGYSNTLFIGPQLKCNGWRMLILQMSASVTYKRILDPVATLGMTLLIKIAMVASAMSAVFTSSIVPAEHKAFQHACRAYFCHLVSSHRDNLLILYNACHLSSFTSYSSVCFLLFFSRSFFPLSAHTPRAMAFPGACCGVTAAIGATAEDFCFGTSGYNRLSGAYSQFM